MKPVFGISSIVTILVFLCLWGEVASASHERIILEETLQDYTYVDLRLRAGRVIGGYLSSSAYWNARGGYFDGRHLVVHFENPNDVGCGAFSTNYFTVYARYAVSEKRITCGETYYFHDRILRRLAR